MNGSLRANRGRLALPAVLVLVAVGAMVAASWPSSPARAVDTLAIAHAGVPDPLDRGEETPAQATDWDAQFALLRSHGVTAFYPDTDSIAEFVTTPDHACDPESPALAALRDNGITLIVPGFLLYPPGWLTQNAAIWDLWFDPSGGATSEGPPAMPPVPEAGSSDDPLQRLIACVGGVEHIYAVTNYDEPAFLFDPYDAAQRVDAPVGLAEVEALYRRVKAVSGATPVMMVHAPIPRAFPVDGACSVPPAAEIPSSPWDFVTGQAWVADYLERVRQFSVWSDWVGFDIYPLPDGVVTPVLADPYRGGLAVERFDLAVDSYMQWLEENVDKPRFLVSQGFTYERNPEVTTAWCLADEALRAPTQAELSAMNERALERGAFLVLYWGIDLLQEADLQPGGFYDAILGVSSEWGQ